METRIVNQKQLAAWQKNVRLPILNLCGKCMIRIFSETIEQGREALRDHQCQP